MAQVERAGGPEPALLNMTASAKLVAAAARSATKAAEAHYWTDYLATDKIGKRTFLTLSEAEKISEGASSVNAAKAARAQ